MRNTFALAAIAPLSLALAACGGNDDVDAGDTTGVAVETPDMPVTYPEIPLDARGSVNYQGTYEQRTADGRTRTVTLGAGDSYTIRDEDGVESTGTFNWYSDNSRILIGDGDDKQVYGIADGTIYRMADEDTPVDGPRGSDNAYVRVNAPAVQ